MQHRWEGPCAIYSSIHPGFSDLNPIALLAGQDIQLRNHIGLVYVQAAATLGRQFSTEPAQTS